MPKRKRHTSNDVSRNPVSQKRTSRSTSRSRNHDVNADDYVDVYIIDNQSPAPHAGRVNMVHFPREKYTSRVSKNLKNISHVQNGHWLLFTKRHPSLNNRLMEAINGLKNANGVQHFGSSATSFTNRVPMHTSYELRDSAHSHNVLRLKGRTLDVNNWRRVVA